MNENNNKQIKKWHVKKPKLRPFNVKLTETMFSEIRELVAHGYSASITEFIRVAVTEKIERITLSLGNGTKGKVATSYPLGEGNTNADTTSHK
jgi:Arc/MetJ-type ribon-helix-helix transcriptional regulator